MEVLEGVRLCEIMFKSAVLASLVLRVWLDSGVA